MLLLRRARAACPRPFRNRAGNHGCRPTGLDTPSSEAEIADVLARAAAAGERAKAVGAGHSWSDAACTDDGRHVSLDPIAGPIATGTHGTGARLPNLSSQVVALRLVTASGRVLELSRAREPELFRELDPRGLFENVHTPHLRRNGNMKVADLVALAVVASVGAMLVAPSVVDGGSSLVCKSNLGSIAKASVVFAEDPPYGWKKGKLPWTARPDATIADDAEARACLELLHKYGLLEDPSVYVCPSSGDEPAEIIDDIKERIALFQLAPENCSYTWRRRLTDVNAGDKTPVSGDARLYHKDGRHVAFLNGNVEYYSLENLEDEADADARRFRSELIGFDKPATPPERPAPSKPPDAASPPPPPQSWARVAPGTTFVVAIVTSRSGAPPEHSEMRYTLIERNDAEAQIRIAGKGAAAGAPATLSVPLETPWPTAPPDQRKQVRVAVPAGEFECTYFKLQDGGETDEFWFTPDVPLPVKYVQTTEAGSVVEQLIKIEKK